MQRRAPSQLFVLFIAFVGVQVGIATVEARSKRHEPTPVESPDDDTLQQAARILETARTALMAHDLATAARRASESFRLVPAPEALFVLGKVALAEKRLLDAQDLLRRYLADPTLESAADSPDQKEAERIGEQPRPTNARLNVLGDRGTIVLIDGRVVGALPLSRPLLISPSEHKLELERGNRHLEDQVRVPVDRLGEMRVDLTTNALLLSILPGVVVLDDYKGVANVDQRRLELAIETAVQDERLSPLSRVEALEAAGEPAPGPCSDARRCLFEVAEKSEADYLLRVRVERQPAAWALNMELFDVSVSEVAAHTERSCAGCNIDEATRQLASLFKPLYTQASARARGRLEVRSDPSDAEVLLDGQPLGRTPYQAAVWAGSRQVTVRKPDYEEEQRPTTLAEGETTRLQIDLRLLPEPPPPPLTEPKALPPPGGRLPRPRWRLALGSLTGLTGLLMLGLGGSALAVDGQCVGGPQVHCPSFYTTQAPGIGLTVTGALFIAAGAVLIALPGPRRPTAAAPPSDAGVGGMGLRVPY